MKKILLLIFITIVSISLSGCSLLSKPQKAALKITTNTPATIFIDGKHSGTTPYENQDLEPGEITLKLVPENTTENTDPFEGLIELTPGVITIVNHEFATQDKSAAGELLTLQSNNRSMASLSVVSQPDAAVVRLDGESKGFTPLVLNQIEPGDHQLNITSPGYESRTINIRAQTGYRLTVSTILAKGSTPQPINEDTEASNSAELNNNDDLLTPTEAPKATTTPSSQPPTPTTVDKTDNSTPELPYVKINDTPTGWLRVRSEPSMAGEEVAKINPGETYPFLDKQSGWYQIKLDNGEKGWIAGQYAKLYE